MKIRHWFLPNSPDVIGLLKKQAAVAVEGVDEFAGWAAGDASAAEAVREAEHRGDAAKWELLDALREAFMTPVEPEDLFALSRSIDWILKYTRDLVTESEVMRSPPDPGIAEMAALLSEAVVHVEEAIGALGSDGEKATSCAKAALRAQRGLQGAYYRGMASLLEVEHTRERISRRELYRRCARLGEIVIDVAERVIYAVVKQS
jgi:uncharacterized protein Yka (UPF0111/DUF47 family)